jgi:hypothetical protein
MGCLRNWEILYKEMKTLLNLHWIVSFLFREAPTMKNKDCVFFFFVIKMKALIFAWSIWKLMNLFCHINTLIILSAKKKKELKEMRITFFFLLLYLLIYIFFFLCRKMRFKITIFHSHNFRIVFFSLWKKATRNEIFSMKVESCEEEKSRRWRGE